MQEQISGDRVSVRSGQHVSSAKPAEAAWEHRRRVSTVAMAAILIAAVNVIALVVLPIARSVFPGETNPTIYLAVGLLLPTLLIVRAAFRAYWMVRQDVPQVKKLGPYVLLGKLGSGGMGEVFLAEHQLMKRQCAIKLIHPEQARDTEMRCSFEQEAKATAQLTHWNTVEVYDYGTTEDGRFYYVMEYLTGVNLNDFVQQYGPMEPERVVYILKQICDALYEADCAGLVHRDIKPSNIFLTERGRSFDVAKLLDFGLVQAVSTEPIKIRNVNKKLRGSPSYMCPEQAVGLSPDARGDLYSLGCVAYFLLTGRPPFVDENPIMLIVAHATGNVPTFKEIGVDVPDDLAAIILRCLQRDPGLRYGSARQLLEDLEYCECYDKWNWKSAEKWWQKHQPKPLDCSSTIAPRDTLPLNKDTKSDLASDSQSANLSDVIDHNEDTIIFGTVEGADDKETVLS